MTHQQTQLLQVIDEVAAHHGEVRGLRPVALALGQDCANTSRRLESLARRGLVRVHRYGRGAPVRIQRV